MLTVLLLVVVAAMAMYEPWHQPLLAPAHATGDDSRSTDGTTRAPNDWWALFANVLYRLGGNGGERHPA